MMKNNVSRRDFLKGAAAGAVGIAAMGVGSAVLAESADTSFEKSINWNGLYDVVVVGFGGAGAVASVTAAEAGAKVLLLDKAPKGHEGGNTRYCMQVCLCPYEEDFDATFRYFQALRGSFFTPSDEMIATYLHKIAENRYWLADRGANVVDLPSDGEFPEYEGHEAIRHVLVEPETFTSKFWKFVHSLVMQHADNIDVWYESPATALIRNPETDAVIGVTVMVDGQEVNIRAKNGVVLSCGGFEGNMQMLQDYTGLPECYAMGTVYNTGDGVKMAARVGAELWHMENIMGPYLQIKFPERLRPEFYSGTLAAKSFFLKNSFLFVGADGTRFIDESWYPRHGFYPFHGRFIHTPVSLPAWFIFDEKTRNTARLCATFNSASDEPIEAGVYIQADTLEALAEKIGVPAENLVNTVTTYNRYCEQGLDEQHGRSPESMIPFDAEGPFYAAELKAAIINTQGGPRRNENTEILDTEGNPIPHLYGAGEGGEMYSSVYQGAGNIAGCIAWGCIAGETAAAAKEDDQPAEDLAIDLYVPVVEGEVYETGENQFIGSSDGMCGDIVVRVTLADGETIAEVEVLKSMETDSYGGRAVEKMPALFVGLNAEEVLGVDGVAMATITSNALKAAVVNAIL